MAELSGTLEGLGLSAIVRFLTGLRKTGCLRIRQDDWHGEIFFDEGEVADASFGTKRGLAALEGLAQALPDAAFAFVSDVRANGGSRITLSADALHRHLDQLATGAASRLLPAVDTVPQVVARADAQQAEDTVPLDRATLQTLLAVDGRRTVGEIISQRGSYDALWQLGSLAELGLITTPTTKSPVDRTVAVDMPPVRCPKLGFEDDPDNSFGRPTRLHRCFAADAPVALSLDEQRELCLTEQFASCPRLATVSADLVAPDEPEAEALDSRIVHLPVRGREHTPEHVDLESPPAAVGSALAPSLQMVSPVVPDDSSVEPIPLWARPARLSHVPSARAVADPPLAPVPPIVPPAGGPADGAQEPVRVQRVEQPAPRTRSGPPLAALAGTVVLALAAVGLVGFLIAARLNTPQAPARIVPVVRPTSVAVSSPAADPTETSTVVSDAGAASAFSAADAPAKPALPPEITPPLPSAPLLDELFLDNARKWPSSPQGTALVSEGAYRLTPRQSGQFVAIGAPMIDVVQDVMVSATFHKVSGPSGGGYGIIVRDQSPAQARDGVSQDGQYYVLEVGDKGEIGVWRRDGDHWTDLVPWRQSGVVNPGTETNEVIVRAIGPQLSLTVNGAEVVTLTDTAFASGGVGLFVGGDGNQVAVERFTVETP